MVARAGAAVVVVNGTRIIARRVLEASDAVFINTHCGITPEYRGVHGGYWALYRSDPENCGVTVHLVDPGIDTGGILAQQRIEPGPHDNFVTYPYLQLAAGLPLLVEAVGSALEGRHIPRDSGCGRRPLVSSHRFGNISGPESGVRSGDAIPSMFTPTVRVQHIAGGGRACTPRAKPVADSRWSPKQNRPTIPSARKMSGPGGRAAGRST